MNFYSSRLHESFCEESFLIFFYSSLSQSTCCLVHVLSSCKTNIRSFKFSLSKIYSNTSQTFYSLCDLTFFDALNVEENKSYA